MGFDGGALYLYFVVERYGRNPNIETTEKFTRLR
jgi:hypothetical protein